MAMRSVAVVGAGPAGATAARLLAERGAEVVCYEARRLPRQKACGGGLTPKALSLLPVAAYTATQRRVERTELRSGGVSAFVAMSPDAAITMVERSEFDHVLARCAEHAGVDMREGERVLSVNEDDRGVTVMTRDEVRRFDALIVADGEPSTCARQLGMATPPRGRSLALELDLPMATGQPDDLARLSFDVPNGYAWYFPKGDHANVGVGSSVDGAAHRALTRDLLRRLHAFAGELSLAVDDRAVKGHWIPQGLRRGRIASRRAVLVGDAAGTADPLLCEGIFYAMISAVVAVGAIIDLDSGRIDDLSPYERRLRELLDPAFRRLSFAARVLHGSPSLSLLAYRLSSWVRTYADDVIAGRTPPFAFAPSPEHGRATAAAGQPPGAGPTLPAPARSAS